MPRTNANSDSENEEEEERQGDEVDPVLVTAGMVEEQGSDEEEANDSDDDEVPSPNQNTHTELVLSSSPPSATASLGSKAPPPATPKPTPAVPSKPAVPLKEAPKRNAAAAFGLKPGRTTDDDFDDEDEGSVQRTQEVRTQPAFASIDMAADAESARKQMDTAPAIEEEEELVEAHVSPAARHKTYSFRSCTKNQYSMVDGDDILHHRIDEEYKPFPITIMQYTAKNPRIQKTGWLEKYFETNMTRVLAQLSIRKTKWPGDGEHDVSLIGSIEVEVARDDATEQTKYDAFTQKMPQLECSKMIQLDERIMTRLYAITNSGLPSKFNPRNENVHYRVVELVHDHSATDGSWQSYVAPVKARSSGSRKAAAAGAAAAGAAAAGAGAGAAGALEKPETKSDAKKQKTSATIQTSLTSHVTSSQSSQSTLAMSATSGMQCGSANEAAHDDGGNGPRCNGNVNGALEPSSSPIWQLPEQSNGTRVWIVKSENVHYSCVENPEGWTIIETKLKGDK
jgi:hypothetical protein